MRRNMRFDGIPFAPVTVQRAEDKPRLVILTDVSLSVRATARFTLHLVHGLQNLFGQVRTFAFVADLVEITDLFEDHPVEQALGLVFGGDVLDVDANSDYGAAFGTFHEDFGSAVNRRSTVIVLGDGRGNGNDPNLEAFAEITRRARETIWLTPEPRYSWGLGGCDLPALRRVLQPRARGPRPDRAGDRGQRDGDRARRPVTPADAWTLDGAVRSPRSALRRDQDNDLAGWIAEDLVGPGCSTPREFERDVRRRWWRRWRPTRTRRGSPSTATRCAALAAGGAPGGTNAGMAPVHERAAALAVGSTWWSWAAASASCRCGWPRPGTGSPRWTCTPGTVRLLGADGAARSGLAVCTRSPGTPRPCRWPTAAPTRCSRCTCSSTCRRGLGAVVLAEMLRVARRRVVVAVPYEDEPNPTWGHVRTLRRRRAARARRRDRPPVRRHRAPRRLARDRALTGRRSAR